MISFPDLPEYAAQATHIMWEPVMGSGERITAAIAMVDADRSVRVINLLSPEVLSLLYRGQGGNAASLISSVSDSIKGHLKRQGSLEGWQPPVSGFYAQPMREFFGVSQDDILDQVAGLHSSLYKAQPPQLPERMPRKDDAAVRQQVRNAAREMIGLKADSIFTPDGIIEVLDKGHRKHLDIPIKTASKVGTIISAHYSTPATIEMHFLRAQSNLSIASEDGKYQPGLFISLPGERAWDKNGPQLHRTIDEIYWRSEKLGHFIESRETPEALASEIISWATDAA